ncbi:MAG: PfkB family carbohydrate kinase [Fusobacteriaceae bacterium]
MKKVITMGEIMLRLTSPGFQRFSQANCFDAIYGGGEANVAVSLSNFGYDAHFVSKLPKNEIGECAKQTLNKYGVKTDYIARGGERLGIYFLETGASMRASKVVYDRANSAISTASVNDFDFDEIFKDAEWFHFTGITPALSSEATIVTEAALKAAKKHGVTVSVDLNYRKKLWSPARAKEVMTSLMKYVDVCIGNEEDAEKVLGFKPANIDVTSGTLELDGYKDIFKQMKEKFGFKYIATTLRESYSASDNGWSALIYDGSEFYHSKKYDVRIVDRVGGGDSFAAGLICGLLDGKNQKESLEFAVASSALKHTIPGDMNLVTREEVETLANGDTSGRVQR